MVAEGNLNYKTIFDMITLPLIIADSDKKIIFANKPGLSLLEIDRGNMSQLTINTLFEISDIELSKVEKALLSDSAYHGTFLFKHDNNEYSHIDIIVKGFPIPLKTRVGYFIECKASKKIEMTDDDIKRLGYCTGKMAHDLSNPLAVLRIHCDNFSLQAKKNTSFNAQDVLTRVRTLSNATDRLNVTNGELKTLSKSLMDLDMGQLMTIIDSHSSDDTPTHFD